MMKKQTHNNHRFFTFTRLIIVAISIRAVVAIIKAFLPFDLPHIWRQVDTLGVAIRYWLRWTTETNVSHPLLPAILNNGDQYGIMPMEFPLLNIISAPFFSLGFEVGTYMARLFLFSIHFLATYGCYLVWRKNRVFTVPTGFIFLLLPFIGITSVYITKFMPDYLAMILVFWGIGLLWENTKPHNRAIAIFFVALGLLMKPTSVIVFAICLLQYRNFHQFVLHWIWLVPSCIVAAMYYSWGISFIEYQSDMPNTFNINMNNPYNNLINFFSNGGAILKIFYENSIAFFSFLLVFPISLLFLDTKKRKQSLQLISILIIQILFIALVDGSHSLEHDYYFIGTAPIIALWLNCTLPALLTQRLSKTSFAFHFMKKSGLFLKKSLAYWILLIIFIINATHISFELRSLQSGRSQKYIWHSEVKKLKTENPNFPWEKGYSFRSSSQLSYPYLGIYFGESEGSVNAKYGFYLKSHDIPSECEVVDQSKSIVLVICQNTKVFNNNKISL